MRERDGEGRKQKKKRLKAKQSRLSAVRGRRQVAGATGWRRHTRTCRLCENSVKWSLIKVANRFVNSLLIRPDSWRSGEKRVTRD